VIETRQRELSAQGSLDGRGKIRTSSHFMAFDEAALQAGSELFQSPCTFVKGVTRMDNLPAGDLGEIAFAGRSNVGKSSLLNALTGRKSLAKTSNTPGRTRELNFFALGELLFIVDMPGYGFARASKRHIRGWTKLVQDYLKGRASLLRVFLLIDSRHGLKSTDLDTLRLMDEAAVSYQAVLTKTDKLKASELERNASDLAAALARHPAAYPGLIATSARTGAGVNELRAAVAALINPGGVP